MIGPIKLTAEKKIGFTKSKTENELLAKSNQQPNWNDWSNQIDGRNGMIRSNQIDERKRNDRSNQIDDRNGIIGPIKSTTYNWNDRSNQIDDRTGMFSPIKPMALKFFVTAVGSMEWWLPKDANYVQTYVEKLEKSCYWVFLNFS